MASRTITSFCVLLAAGFAAGQTTSLKGPISGLIYDAPSRGIRTVMGFPGSSYLGVAVVKDVEMASIAPDGESALVLEGGKLGLIQALRGAGQVKATLAEPGDSNDQVAWASNSTAAVVYSALTRRLQRLDLRTSGLNVEPAIDLSYLEGQVTCLVTNDDASRTLIGIRHPDLGGFYEISGGASPVRLFFTPNPGAAVFGNSGEVYAIDSESRQVLRLGAVSNGGVESLSFAGEAEPLADPVGIGLSRNGQRLYVAGGLDRVVREYDLNSRTLVSVLSVDVAPKYLAPLAATNSVFVLAPRASTEQPTWILDGRLEASVFFVPAGE